MNQKNVAAVLLAIATMLGGPPAVQHALHVNEEIVEDASISGPETAEVGELVHLSLPGSRTSWLMPVEDYHVLHSGSDAVISFRDEGDHEIIGTAVIGGKSKILRHVIKVGTVEPDQLVPVPVPDDVPQPEPDDLGPSLADDVYEWAKNYNCPKETSRKLGQNFIDAASQAESIDDLLKRTATANRKVKQKGCERVLAMIQQRLFDEYAGKDFEAHKCAWDEIGTGLLRWADEASPSGASN